MKMMKAISHISLQQLQAFIDCCTETDQVPDKGACDISLEDLTQKYIELNLSPGTVVLVMLHNSKQFIKHIFSISLAGHVPALVPPSTPTIRVNKIVENFNAKAILKNKIFRNSYAETICIQKIGSVELALIQNNKTHSTRPGELILTTSGTSGFSSGCVFDFSALIRNAEKHADVIQLSERDVVLVNLPMFYSYAFVAQMLSTLVRLAKLVISAPPFNTQQYLKDINYYSVTVSAVTPMIVKDLINNRSAFGKSLRVISVGGDKLTEQDLQLFMQQCSPNEVYLTYGITEAGPRVSTLAVHNEPTSKWNSVGRALPGTKASLFVADNQLDYGELIIHSDTLVKYRLGNPDKPLFIELNGLSWLKTGDLFHIDEDGYLFYKDRLSDFIILSGEKVNLADIKRHVIHKINALSTKICLIKEESNIIGFGLDILMPNDAEFCEEALLKTLNRDLKVYERPKFIEIMRVGDSIGERYK